MIQPYFKNNYISIYCASSENMSFVSNDSVQCIITSPPYNVGINYDNINDKKNLTEYYSFLTNVFKECFRVLCQGGKICVNVPSIIRQSSKSKNAFVSIYIWEILEKIGFAPKDLVIWIKTLQITNQKEYQDNHRHQSWGKSTSWGSWMSPSCPSLRDVCELIIIMEKPIVDKKQITQKQKDITPEEYSLFAQDCWFILPTNEKKSGHPAAFPEELPYRLIKLFTCQEDTVLDPFAGSGTTGVVAQKLKRKSILIDVSSKYCELQKNKLNQLFLFN